MGQVGLEPTKRVAQRIYSPPPLPLGTLTRKNMTKCYRALYGLANLPKPTMGLEPITYALQEHCSAN